MDGMGSTIDWLTDLSFLYTRVCQFDALFDLLTGREHLELYARVKVGRTNTVACAHRMGIDGSCVYAQSQGIPLTPLCTHHTHARMRRA